MEKNLPVYYPQPFESRFDKSISLSSAAGVLFLTLR